MMGLVQLMAELKRRTIARVIRSVTAEAELPNVIVMVSASAKTRDRTNTGYSEGKERCKEQVHDHFLNIGPNGDECHPRRFPGKEMKDPSEMTPGLNNISEGMASQASKPTLPSQHGDKVIRRMAAAYSNKFGSEATIKEEEMIYRMKTHMISMAMINRPHIEMVSTADKRGKIGSASFHKTTMKVDVVVDGHSLTLKGQQGYRETYFTFPSTSFGPSGEAASAVQQTMKWKRHTSSADLVLVDSCNETVARIEWGKRTANNRAGEILIFAPAARDIGRPCDEIVVTGMALIHLSLYMTMYSGGQSAEGLVVV